MSYVYKSTADKTGQPRLPINQVYDILDDKESQEALQEAEVPEQIHFPTQTLEIVDSF